MSKQNTATLKYWLILSLAGFGLGALCGWVTQRDWQKAFIAGTIGAPILCVSSQLIPSKQPATPKRTTAKRMTPPPPQQPGNLPSSHVAVFWDYENVHMSDPAQMSALAEAIATLAQANGHSLKKYVYSNWGHESKKATPPLSSHGFNAIHVAMGKTNSVDVKLAVDCISMAYDHPEIDHFVLVTSDKDYISLINKLRELRRKVILIGSDHTSHVMQASATQFIPLSEILPDRRSRPTIKPTPAKPRLSFDEGLQCLMTVLSKRTNAQQSHFSLSQIDKLMRNEPSSAYRGCASITRPDSEHGFSKFSEFLHVVEAQGHIQLHQHESKAYVSLPNTVEDNLKFADAVACVLYALALDHEFTSAETYQDVNIAYLPGLIRKHLKFAGFTPTKIPMQQKEGPGRYKSLSAFLQDVADTGAITLRRDAGLVYATLVEAPETPPSPASLLEILAQVHPEGVIATPEETAETAADTPPAAEPPKTPINVDETNEHTPHPQAPPEPSLALDSMDSDTPDNPPLMVA